MAAPGHKLIVADYYQIELRAAAAIAGETKMIEAYRRGVDDARHSGGGPLRLDRARFLVDSHRHRLHIPHEPERRHYADGVPREIVFPPVEPVTRGPLIAVVVVVPPLAGGEERRDRVVA